MSQNIESSTSLVGIILQDFDPRPPRYSLEESMRNYMRSPDVSNSARNLLERASPSRCRSDRSETQLVIVEGHRLPKDPHSEAIRRVAYGQGYKQPSLEDALRIFPSISFDELSPKITSLWVMHHPIDNEVLGFTLVNGFITLSAHKAEPREGWFCETCGFIFRCS
jgi:hypothetical protein